MVLSGTEKFFLIITQKKKQIRHLFITKNCDAAHRSETFPPSFFFGEFNLSPIPSQSQVRAETSLSNSDERHPPPFNPGILQDCQIK